MKYPGHLTQYILVAAAVSVGAVTAFVTAPKAPANVTETVSFEARNLTSAADDNKTNLRVISAELRANDKASVDESTEVVQCIDRCQSALNLLNDTARIDDETYESFTGWAEGLAAHLKADAKVRGDMLELLQTTEDGNKRALIVDALKLLPPEQREAASHVISSSDNPLLRADGARLLATPQAMTPDGAPKFIASFTDETDRYVKTVVLGALENAETLQGDRPTLNYLSEVMMTEADPAVRSKALQAKLMLQKNPQDSMPDALLALRSGDPEFQFAAFSALERIYALNEQDGGGLAPTDDEAVKRALEDLMNVEVTSENASEVQRLLEEADLFYARHFVIPQ